jgi:hypothetical protein
MIALGMLNTSLEECSRCGPSSRINVRYGATKAHSSSVTSLGVQPLGTQDNSPAAQITQEFRQAHAES